MKILLHILTVLCFTNATAQFKYPYTTNAKKVLDSKLVVALRSGDTPEVAAANALLQETMTAHWKATPILFMKPAQIDSLQQLHKDGYAYLYQHPSNTSIGSFRKETGLISRTYTDFTFLYYKFSLKVPVDGEERLVTSIGFINEDMVATDYVFLSTQLSRLLNDSAAGKKRKEYFNIKNNIAQLKTTTVLFPKSMVKEKDWEKIAKYYKYNYKLVSDDEYTQAVLNREEGKAYPQIVWSVQHTLFMWLVVDCATGQSLSINSFGYGYTSMSTTKSKIRAKHLKYTASKLAQKINSRY